MAVVAGMLVASGIVAEAASATWTGTTGSWTATTWTGGAAPGATGTTNNPDVATFASSGAGTVTVDSGRNVAGITFNGSSAYTLTGGSLVLSNGGTVQNTSAGTAAQNVNSAITLEGAYTFDSSAASATNVLNFGAGGITQAVTGSLTLQGSNTGTNTISGVIADGAGTMSLIKTGVGSWTLSGTNTYSGGTTVNGGTLSFSNVSGLGSGAVAIGSSGTVNDTVTGSIANAFTGTGTLTMSGPSGSQQQFTSSTALNSFTGTLNINTSSSSGGKTILATSGQTIGSGATVNIASGSTLFIQNASTISGVTFNITGTGNSEFFGALRIDGPTIGATSAVNLLSNASIGTNGAAGTINAVIAGGFSLAKEGSGTLTLGANNTYSGGTILTAGELSISSDTTGAYNLGGASTAITFNGGTLGITGTAITNRGSHTITFTNNASAGFDIAAAANTFTLSQQVALGTGSFSKVGAGSLTLGGGFANSAKVITVSGGGVLDLGSGNFTLSDNGSTGITGTGGTINATGGGQIVLGSNGGTNNGLDFGVSNGNTLTINAVISGSNPLDFYSSVSGFNGTGVVVLAGANTFTGVADINSGVVSVSSIGNASTAGGLGQSASAINFSSGNTTTAPVLRYTGAGESTSRVVTLLSGTSAAYGSLDASGTGAITYSAFSNPGAAASTQTKTFGLLGSGSGVFSGNLTDAAAGTTGLLALSLTKTGTGTWTLSGANTYTGSTTLSAGTLNLGSAGALGGNGSFALNGGTLSNTFGTAITSTGSASIGGGFAFGAAGQTSANNVTFSGTTGFNLGLTQTIALAGTNTTLTLGSTWTNNASTAQTLTVNSTGTGDTLALGGLALNSGNNTALTQTVNGNGNLNVTGAVTNGTATGAQALSYTGSGTLTLGGVNTYTGLTTLNNASGTLVLAGNNTNAGGVTLTAGTLDINASGTGSTNSALGTGTLNIAGGTTIDNTSTSAVTLATSNVVNIAGDFTYGGTKNLAFGGGNVNLTLPAANGTRTITLNGTNSTLTFGGAESSANAINGNTTLAVNGTGNTLVFGSTYALSSDTTAGGHTETFAGSGNVTVNGAVTNGASGTAQALTYGGTGTMTLGGSNSYTGVTSVTSGTLVLANANASATGATSVAAGTLQLQNAGSISSSGSLGLSNGSVLQLRSNTSGTTFSTGTAFNLPSTQSGSGLNLSTTIDASDLSGVTTGNTLNLGASTVSLGGTASNVANSVTLNVTSSNGDTLGLGAISISTVGGGNGNQGNFIINPTTGNVSIASITESGNSSDNTITFQGSGNTSVGAISDNAAAAAREMILNFSSTGTVTLSGVNSFTSTGGSPSQVDLFNVNSGTVNFNNAGVWGTSGQALNVTINGGTIDNTSGSAITVANARNSTWAGSFGFTGSNPLNLGAGAVSVTSNTTVTTTANTLTAGATTLGTGVTLAKAGSGTLTLGNITTAIGSSITASAGTLNLGTINMNTSNLTASGGTINTGNLSFTNGASTIISTGGIFNLGTTTTAFSQSGTGSVDFSGTLTNINTSNANVAQIGTWATVNNGAAFAAVSNGKIVAFSGTTLALPTVATSSTTNNYTLNVSQTQTGNVSGNTLQITNGANSQTLNLAGQNLTFTNNNGVLYSGGFDNNFTITGTTGVLGSGSTNTFVANAAGGTTLTINSLIVSSTATAGSLNKAGSGTVILGAANVYTGATTVSAGTLAINGTLGNSAVTVNGGTLSLQNTGAVSQNTVTVNNTGNVAETVANGLSGTAALVINNGGVATLSQANSYSGATTLAAGGTLTLANSLAMQNSPLAGAGSGVVFDSSVASHAFTLAGLNGSNNIALQDNASTPNAVALTVGNGNVTSSYSGVLSGAGTLTKVGSGTFSASGANTFTGGLNVQNGVYSLGSTNAYFTNAAGSGTVTLGQTGAANTTLVNFTNIGRTFANAFVTQGTGGSNTIQSLGAGQNFNFTGGFTLNNDLTFNTSGLTSGNTSDTITVLTGGISGTGNLYTTVGSNVTSGGAITISSGVNMTGLLTNNGTGTSAVTIGGVIGNHVTGVVQNSATSSLILSGANTYAGGTTLNAGTLVLNNGTAGTTTASALGTGALTIAGGSIDSTVANITLGTNNAQNWNGDFNFVGSNNLNLGTGAVTLSAARQVTVTANNLTVGGAIGDGGNGYGLTKAGAGTLTLTGANTFSGTTTVNAGTLDVANALALQDSNVAYSTGIVLDSAAGTAFTFGALSGGNNFALQNSAGAAINLTVGNNSSSTTYSGVLGDGTTAGSQLTKTGSGTLTLTGANIYSGNTTISAGTLALGSGGALYSGLTGISALVTDNGTLDISQSGNLTIGDLSGSGIVNLGQYNLTLNDAASTFSGAINDGGLATGTTGGSLTVNSGVLTLSGSSSFTGPTTINGGIINYESSASLGQSSPITVINGATLQITNVTGDVVGGSQALSLAGTGLSNIALENVSGNNSYAGAITLTANTNIKSDSGSLTLSGGINTVVAGRTLTVRGSGNTTIGTGAITGGGSVTMNGAGGVLTLTGANTYTGTTTVTAGTIQVGNGSTGSINNSSSAVVSSGATLGFNEASGGSYTHNITDNGILAGTESSGVVNTLSGAISGSGSFNQTGAGATILSSSAGNTYSGGTTISAGKVYVTNNTSGITSGSGTGSGAIGVSGTGVLNLAHSGTNAGSVSGAITLTSGGSLYSGGVSSGTPATGSGKGAVLSSALNVNGGNLTFALTDGGTGGTFASPLTTTSYISTSSTVNFTGNDQITLVDLTNGGLSLRMNQPYLLISSSLGNAGFTGLVTSSDSGVLSLDGNGYVVGVYTGGSSSSTYTYNPISFAEFGSDGVTPLTSAGLNGRDVSYLTPTLYLYNGNLEVVPEPGTWALMIGGLALLVVIQRRRCKGQL